MSLLDSDGPLIVDVLFLFLFLTFKGAGFYGIPSMPPNAYNFL